MSITDTHIHLTDNRYAEIGIDQIIKEAEEAGIAKLITLGVDLVDSTNAADLSEKFDNVFFCAGIHPHEADKVSKNDIEKIQELFSHSKCVGLGEVGLDYYYEFSNRNRQKEVFTALLEVTENNMPIVLHTRGAEQEVWESIKHRTGKYLCHSYSGEIKFIEDYLSLGTYFSFNGMITFKKAQNIREMAKQVPLERIMVESDGPYLSPVPCRGKINMPHYIVKTIQVLAEVIGLSYEETERLTTKNAERFFGA